MYMASKPTLKAIRADNPSYTPGQTMRSLVSFIILRSLVAPDIGLGVSGGDTVVMVVSVLGPFDPF